MANGTSALRRARRARQAVGLSNTPLVGGVLLPDLAEIQQVAGSWYSTAIGTTAKQLANLQSARNRLIAGQEWFADTARIQEAGRAFRASTAYDVLMGRRR